MQAKPDHVIAAVSGVIGGAAVAGLLAAAAYLHHRIPRRRATRDLGALERNVR